MPRTRSSPAEILDLASHVAPHVSPRQLALYWAVHVVTVQRWLREGELRGARFRGVWRIKTNDAQLYEFKLFGPRAKAS